MAWILIDDHFDEHPKLQQIGPAAWGMWLAALAYCNRNLTDGFIPWAKARNLVNWSYLGSNDGDDRGRKIYQLGVACGMSGQDLTCELVIEQLLEACLWEEVDGGYHVHDYDQWQRTKSQIEEERAKKVAAGQAGGQASAQARAQAKSNPKPKPKPNVVISSEITTAAPLPPKGEPPPPSKYEQTLNGAMEKIEDLFQGIDAEVFTSSWLRGVLRDAEPIVGPLSRDQLGRGLNVAMKEMRRRMASAKPPDHPRPYARKLIVDYLTEQRDEHHAA